MITKYQKFNEDVVELREYDRVIAHGELRVWNDDNWGDERSEHSINMEGQTGIIFQIMSGHFKMCGVVFDNYFYPKLSDLDGNLKIKRGLWLPMNKIERIEKKSFKDEKPLTFSDKAKRLFELCEYIKCPFWLNIDYVDITDKNDYVSYITKDRLNRLQEKDDVWNNNFRQEVRVGRFLQTINPYTNLKSLEKKINLYKGAYNGIILKRSTFRIVRGDEIYKWYDEFFYQEGTGQLNKSCMRNEKDRLRLYVENPEKISLLILINENNRLEGRALVWNVDKPDITYMDRIYTVYQEDVHRFENYAKQRGWKYFETYGFNHMIVQMKRNEGTPEENPYMDTFTYFYLNGKYGKYYLSTNYEDDNYEDFYEYNYI